MAIALPTIVTRSFQQFVQSFAAAAQAASKTALDFSVGSVGLAIGEASSFMALWFQRMGLRLLALTRAQTSTGADLDSWMAQWPLPIGQSAFTRLPATYATGTVTFTRGDTSLQGVVTIGPAGTAQLQSADGTQGFTVTLDTANAYYNPATGSYVCPAGTASIIVPAVAVNAGTVGNVAANTITSIVDGTISNIDSVTNVAAFTGGMAAENDDAFRQRFQLAIAALPSADETAIESAIANVQQGLFYLLVENKDYPGLGTDYGSFFVVIDDGSHNPPSSLLTAVYNAIYAVRAFTVRPQGVYGPTTVTVSLSGTITSAPGLNHGTVVQAVDAAWANWLNTMWQSWVAYLQTLPAGTAPTPITVSVAAAVDVALSVPGVINVSVPSVLINGSNADLALTLIQVPVPGTVAAA